MENKFKSFLEKLKGWGVSVEKTGSGSKDPVCGMTVSDNRLTFEYQGKTYRFCSEHCKEQFSANPGNYL